MKKLYVLILIISLFTLVSFEAFTQPKKCPVLSELEKTSLKDKKEVIEALKTLIPKTYGTGLDDFPDMYIKWNVVTAKPFLKTVGNKEEEDYFGMAKTFCGKEIAEKSWLVRLDFPKAPGADLAQGQIFLAKSKDKGWFVWFQYH
ncbi:hypothetical protein [Paenisporosarcina indica]|uniref:hypothetical protein n=1 Tax=Paenisporosarcina indica TaxID=650093 RepID=UPI000B0391D5|nr:hypothetical protein [Paenisporosarcina indica]